MICHCALRVALIRSPDSGSFSTWVRPSYHLVFSVCGVFPRLISMPCPSLLYMVRRRVENDCALATIPQVRSVLVSGFAVAHALYFHSIIKSLTAMSQS